MEETLHKNQMSQKPYVQNQGNNDPVFPTTKSDTVSKTQSTMEAGTTSAHNSGVARQKESVHSITEIKSEEDQLIRNFKRLSIEKNFSAQTTKILKTNEESNFQVIVELPDTPECYAWLDNQDMADTDINSENEGKLNETTITEEPEQFISLEARRLKGLNKIIAIAENLLQFLSIRENCLDPSAIDWGNLEDNGKSLISIPPIEVFYFKLIDQELKNIWDLILKILPNFVQLTITLLPKDQQDSSVISVGDLQYYVRALDAIRDCLKLFTEKLNRNWGNSKTRTLMHVFERKVLELINDLDNNLRVEIFCIKAVCSETASDEDSIN